MTVHQCFPRAAEQVALVVSHAAPSALDLRTPEESAELGRSLGAYGPEFHVGEDASEFDRALGAAGRDPHWRAT